MNIKSKIKNLFKPGETLSQKVARSAIWIGFSKVVERILRFIRTIIVARLLSPADFGLFGIACLAMDILQTFTETGAGSALIQKKEKTEEYLDTAWTASLVRSIVLFFALFFFSPLVAKFFNNPGASGVTKAVAFTVLFSGFSNIGTIYFAKDIDFRKQFVLEISKIISNSVVTIVFAFILRNTWALVWGMLAGSITNCIMSYVMHPYRPKFHFEWSKAKELFKFGKWMFWSTILIFLITQGDDILVGKVLGTIALGFYTMAYAISNLAATEVTGLISQITFPVYSKLQDNLPKLKETYLRTLQLTAFISFPVAGGIFILCPEFIKLFLGDKWLPMVSTMQVLCLFGLIRSIVATMGPVFQGVGRPKILTIVSFAQLVILAAIIYPLILKHGILGAAIATVIALVAVQMWTFHQIAKIIKVNIATLFNILRPSFLATLFFILFLTIIKNNLHFALNYFIFILFMLLMTVIYLSAIFIMRKDIIFNPKFIFKAV